MNKANKINKAAKKTQKKNKIPAKATEIKQESTENKTPVFAFRNVCNNHCQLSNWNSTELSGLIDTFKKMESMTWKDIKKHPGLNIKPVEGIIYSLPSGVPDDATIQEVKVDEKKRLFGYRARRVFYIIWFDRNHEVIPMNKNKRKRA